MKLQVLESSSAGNCYILETKTDKLIIDAGISYKEVQKGLNFNFKGVVGTLVTHEHQDHCKAVKDLIKNSINVYMSKGTAKALKLESHRIKHVSSLKQFDIGDFTILPFETEHDCAEPLGFLIQYKPTGEKVLYATDTYYLKYKFNNLNYLLLECNYITDIVKQNLQDESLHSGLYKRTLRSHFSLENVLEFLKSNDLTQVRKIVIIHLSDRNSDYKRMKLEIERLTKKEVIVADKNMAINLELYDF